MQRFVRDDRHDHEHVPDDRTADAHYHETGGDTRLDLRVELVVSHHCSGGHRSKLLLVEVDGRLKFLHGTPQETYPQ